MPHITVEYTRELEASLSPLKMMETAHKTAMASDQFREQDIKVRAQAYDVTLVGGEPQPMMHITIRLLDGRSEEIKKALSQSLLDAFLAFDPGVKSLSVDVCDIIRTTYSKVHV